MSVAYTRISLLSASHVSRWYYAQIGCFSSQIHEHLQLSQLMFRGCISYRWFACQALRLLFHHISWVMFQVHIQHR